MSTAEDLQKRNARLIDAVKKLMELVTSAGRDDDNQWGDKLRQCQADLKESTQLICLGVNKRKVDKGMKASVEKLLMLVETRLALIGREMTRETTSSTLQNSDLEEGEIPDDAEEDVCEKATDDVVTSRKDDSPTTSKFQLDISNVLASLHHVEDDVSAAQPNASALTNHHGDVDLRAIAALPRDVDMRIPPPSTDFSLPPPPLYIHSAPPVQACMPPWHAMYPPHPPPTGLPWHPGLVYGPRGAPLSNIPIPNQQQIRAEPPVKRRCIKTLTSAGNE